MAQPSQRARAPRRPPWAALVVIALLAAVVVALPSRARQPVDMAERLHAFLAAGPAQGLWQVNTLDGTTEWLIGPHPDDRGCVLVARVMEDGQPGQVHVRTRQAFAKHFVPGAEDLFFRNYRPLAEPVAPDDLPGALQTLWIPRHEWGGDTGRTLVVDVATREVLRFEDRSWAGNCVRCLIRLSSDDPGLSPGDVVGPGACDRGAEPALLPSPERLAADVPFPLLAPTYLPEGFALVAAGYRSLTIPARGGLEARAVSLAWLAYSDGLANIDVGVATPADRDALEAWAASGRPRSDDPEVCPPVPEAVRPIDADGVLIRRRRDRCRTVLRMDGRDGVSVSLLGRNEIPEDEYIHVLSSVVRVQPVRAP